MGGDNAGSRPVRSERVIFSSKYGGFPRFIWYAAFPFLLLVSAALFIRAVWFDGGLLIKSVSVSPWAVAHIVCPLMWTLCGLIGALEFYRHRRPQFVLVSSWGVRLPKGRFTSETIAIAWDDLQATLETTNLKGWHVSEITCTDLRSDASTRVSSALFWNFDDFATFALILAQHMGQDWSFPGFWPGTFRGRKPPGPVREA